MATKDDFTPVQDDFTPVSDDFAPLEAPKQNPLAKAGHVVAGVASALAPYAVAAGGSMIKPIAERIPVVGQIGFAAGHGLNAALQLGEKAKTEEAAQKVEDIDPVSLRNHYFAALQPGLSAKGYNDDEIMAEAIRRAGNAVSGGYETAQSMRDATTQAQIEEGAAGVADAATFGIDAPIVKRFVTGALAKIGIRTATEGAAKAAAMQAVQAPARTAIGSAIRTVGKNAGMGALYGATDAGLRRGITAAGDAAVIEQATPQDVAKALVSESWKGAKEGGTAGALLGGTIFSALHGIAGIPEAIKGAKSSTARAEAIKLMNGEGEGMPPSALEHPPGELKPYSMSSQRDPREAYFAGEHRNAAARNFEVERDARTYDPGNEPPDPKVDPSEFAQNYIASKYGETAARTEEGMRAASIIEQKVRIYHDANAEIAPRELGAPTAAPASPTLGPPLGSVESGGAEPAALAPPEVTLPGGHPTAGGLPHSLPGTVPPGAGGGEAPIMSLGTPPAGTPPEAFGERAITNPPTPTPPTTDQLAQGWAKELGFTPKKTRAKATPAEKPRNTNAMAQSVVDEYRSRNGFTNRPGRDMYPPLDAEKAAQIAQEYHKLSSAEKGTPEYEKAKVSYDALNSEVAQQFKSIQDAGYKIDFVEKDPYKNSAEMRADVRDNHHLSVFKTPEGHHPFMTPEQSDMFRAVHDFFGHAAEGYEFGPRGEEAAFRQHAATLSNDAIPALASETRGQNSWVNFLPENAKLPVSERPFAEQKGTLMPEDTYSDVLHGDRVPVSYKPEGIHVGVPVGDATQHDMNAALDQAVSHADQTGVPITAELTRIDAPQGGRIPVEKQFEKFYEPRGFKMTELVRSPEGQIQTARLRRDAIPPPKGGVLEAQGTMFGRIAQKADQVAGDARKRLNGKLGRMNAGFDPSMVGDAALDLAASMFAKGIRGTEEMAGYLRNKYGEKVEPHLKKIIEVAQKHFMRFFKGDEQARQSLSDLLDMKESGAHGADWYEKVASWAKKNAGPDHDMFLRFLAVTSANGQTESGAALALKAMAQWKAGLKFTGMRGPSMTGQLERIAKGENLGDYTKIENFYRALKGDPDAVVLDRWMLRAMGIGNQSALSPKNYNMYANVVRQLAEMNGMSPRQFQAAVWEGARVGHLHETEAAGGRQASTKVGSGRPLEELIGRKLDGMTLPQYLANAGGDLQKMQHIYEGLKPVRSGEAVGHTFNLDTFEPDDKPGYVVSLVSTNVPKSVLYPARIQKVIRRVQPLIDYLKAQGQHPTLGVFASELHPGQYSIDLNTTLPNEAQAQAIATANRQESFAHLGEGGQWIENIPSQWNKKGKQFLPPKDGRLHREWYAAQIERVKDILKRSLQ